MKITPALANQLRFCKQIIPSPEVPSSICDYLKKFRLELKGEFAFARCLIIFTTHNFLNIPHIAQNLMLTHLFERFKRS